MSIRGVLHGALPTSPTPLPHALSLSLTSSDKQQKDFPLTCRSVCRMSLNVTTPLSENFIQQRVVVVFLICNPVTVDARAEILACWGSYWGLSVQIIRISRLTFVSGVSRGYRCVFAYCWLIRRLLLHHFCTLLVQEEEIIPYSNSMQYLNPMWHVKRRCAWLMHVLLFIRT